MSALLTLCHISDREDREATQPPQRQRPVADEEKAIRGHGNSIQAPTIENSGTDVDNKDLNLFSYT